MPAAGNKDFHSLAAQIQEEKIEETKKLLVRPHAASLDEDQISQFRQEENQSQNESPERQKVKRLSRAES